MRRRALAIQFGERTRRRRGRLWVNLDGNSMDVNESERTVRLRP